MSRPALTTLSIDDMRAVVGGIAGQPPVAPPAEKPGERWIDRLPRAQDIDRGMERPPPNPNMDPGIIRPRPDLNAPRKFDI